LTKPVEERRVVVCVELPLILLEKWGLLRSVPVWLVYVLVLVPALVGVLFAHL